MKNTERTDPLKPVICVEKYLGAESTKQRNATISRALKELGKMRSGFCRTARLGVSSVLVVVADDLAPASRVARKSCLLMQSADSFRQV